MKIFVDKLYSYLQADKSLAQGTDRKSILVSELKSYNSDALSSL